MKVTVNFEFTPEEARDFLGLPDMKPMQETLMKEVEQRMLSVMNPQAMTRAWMPMGMQGFEQMQKMFWTQIQQNMSNVANMTGGMAMFGERKAVK